MANETVIADLHEFTNHRMRLNPRSMADHHTSLDLNKRADKAVIADVAFVEVDRLNDLYSGAKRDVANLGFMYVRTAHQFPFSSLCRNAPLYCRYPEMAPSGKPA
jgi:hypothetical protein